MDSFHCNLSGTAVLSSSQALAGSPILHLHLTNSRRHFITSNHRPQEVNSPVEQFRRFPIPQNCILFRTAAWDFVSDRTRSTGINLSDSDLDRIVSCIYRGGAEVDERSFVVFATVSLSPTDVFYIGAIPWRPNDMSGSSSSSDVSCKNLKKNFKKMKIDKKEAGDEICAICLDGFEKECSLIRTPCYHLFHHGCIKKWMMKKNSSAECPMCSSADHKF